jgi:hypothetical protein
MISIPTFEEMDEISFSSSTPTRSTATDNSYELVSPVTARPNPFGWTRQPNSSSSSLASSSNGGGSPFLSRSQTPDSEWSATPTESTFSSAAIDLDSIPLSTSPSLPSIPSDHLNRPFTPQRRRADTAPSFEYPPLGPGIPSSLSQSDSASGFGVGGPIEMEYDEGTTPSANGMSGMNRPFATKGRAGSDPRRAALKVRSTFLFCVA